MSAAAPLHQFADIGVEQPDGRILPGRALLGFDPADPAAVLLSFNQYGADPRNPVRMEVSRHLLACGLDCGVPVGEGQVHIWSTPDGGVRFRILDPDATSEVLFRRDDLFAFLVASEVVVPSNGHAESEAIWASMAPGFDALLAVSS